MISHRSYFEFRFGSDRYALARPSPLRGSTSLVDWFAATYEPPFKAAAEPAWDDLPRVLARDVFQRWSREARASERRDLLAWLSRGARPAAPHIASGEVHLLREAQADLDRHTLVVFRRQRPQSGRSALEEEKPPLVQLGPEPLRFAVRWVDEQGQGIATIPLEFTHAGGAERQSTDPSGTGCLRCSSSAATVHVADEAKLRQLLKARWSKPGANQPWLTSRDALVIPLGDGRLPSIDLSPEAARLVSVQPDVTRVRLVGGFFDTSKCFILPSGLPAVRALVAMYERQANAKLLIVGHTDTAGKPEYNDPLSLERARSLKDYLTDDVDAWLSWYGAGVATEKRWGAAEDRMMIDAQPDAASRAKTEHPVRWFQRTRGLQVDGMAGPETRKALVAAYMALDGTSLPAGVAASMHGCGENFPQQPTGDGKTEPENRRVEVFFFPGSLGVLPAPPGDNSKPGSKEYPEWVKRARHTEDHSLGVGFKVRLVSGDGHPIPEAGFEIRFSDGSTQRGQLDAHGTALVNGPKGPFTIEYLDHGDIRAKALAARAYHAIQDTHAARLLGVLSQSSEELARVSDAYAMYFNTSGNGLAADARSALGETEDSNAGDHLLAASGIEPEPSAVVVACADPSLTPTPAGAPAQGGVLV